MIKDVLEKLKMDKPTLAPDYVWHAYAALEDVKSQKPENELTALVSLIRRACGIDKTVTAFDKKIDDNFNKWIFKQQVEDLDYTPFDAHGGRGKMWQLFGEEMENIIKELNTELVA